MKKIIINILRALILGAVGGLSIGLISSIWWLGLALGGTISIGSYFIFLPDKPKLPDVTIEVDPYDDQKDVIEKGRKNIKLINIYTIYLSDEIIIGKIIKICSNANKIIDSLIKDPGKFGMTKTFFNYYLPVLSNVLSRYREVEKNNFTDEDSKEFKQKVSDFLDDVSEGFEKLLQNMYKDDILDITTDINVLKHTMRTQGLSDDDDFNLKGGGKNE